MRGDHGVVDELPLPLMMPVILGMTEENLRDSHIERCIVHDHLVRGEKISDGGHVFNRDGWFTAIGIHVPSPGMNLSSLVIHDTRREWRATVPEIQARCFRVIAEHVMSPFQEKTERGSRDPLPVRHGELCQFQIIRFHIDDLAVLELDGNRGAVNRRDSSLVLFPVAEVVGFAEDLIIHPKIEG